ncbi:Glycosyl transferase 4-like domain-containing protein [Rhizobiales bacterium GAS188]|nr:Glycosyl transferase 4-like domain-containing protein [Rhizobiales bacterium GAS188]
MKYRLAILSSHPIQYFAPLYRRLAREANIEMIVYYCDKGSTEAAFDPGFGRMIKWDLSLLEGYRYVFLPNLRKQRGFHRHSLINPSIITQLFRHRYDAIWLDGYNYVTNIMALVAARLTGTPVFYRSESSLTYDRVRRRPWYIRFTKSVFIRLVFHQVSAFLAIGTMNTEFYRHYGVPQNRIVLVPYTVDNEFFADRAAELRVKRDEIRAAMGILPDTVVFLFPAKLIPIKQPLEALSAYKHIRCRNKALLIAGDGELREAMENRVAREEIPSVHFLGFVNQSELPRVYAISDVLLRLDSAATGDWGLTVNEGMASGLAVIASNQIASAVDLMRHGDNGMIVKYGDQQAFTDAMERMAADVEACRRMGVRSSELIRGWSYEECVAGVMTALRSHARHRWQHESPGEAADAGC